MKICDNFDHEDIVYDSRACPLCDALENVKELEKGMVELSEELNRARDAIDNHG